MQMAQIDKWRKIDCKWLKHNLVDMRGPQFPGSFYKKQYQSEGAPSGLSERGGVG